MPCLISAQQILPGTSKITKTIVNTEHSALGRWSLTSDSVKRILGSLAPDSMPVSDIKKILSQKIQPFKSAYSLDKLKNIKNIPGDIFNKPLMFNGLSAVSSGYYTNERMDTARSGFYLSNAVQADVAVLGVPLSGRVMTQHYSESSPSHLVNTQLNYTREQYLTVLREKLKGKINPADFLPKDFNPVDALKAEAENMLKAEVNALRNKYGDILNSQLASLGDPAMLFSLDPNTIRQKIMGSTFLDSVSSSEKLLDKLQDEKLLGHFIDTSTLNSANAMVERYKASMKLVSTIMAQYNKWNESGLLNAIRQNDLLRKQKVNEMLKNPDLVMKLAREKLNLGSFQRMMMNFNTINIGQHTLNQSPLSMQGMLGNGAQIEMLKNNNYLSGVMGKQKTYNSLADMPFSSNLTSNDYRYGGITFGKGLPGSQHSHFTIMSFSQNAGMNTVGVDPVMVPRNSIVTTFSKAFNTGKSGFLSFDVSKASNQFKGEWNVADSSLSSKSPLSNYFDGSFIDNMALSVSHEGYWKGADLQHSVMIKATGRNYQNPGAAFIPAGSKEMLAFLKKSFFKKKLQLSLRENIREYNFGSSAEKWRNMQTALDVKWKLRKGQYFSLRYTPTAGNRISAGVQSKINSTQRLSAEYNFRTRFGKFNYTHFLNLAYQQSKYAGADYQAIAYSSMLITSLQSLQIGMSAVYCNVNYNRVSNSSDIFYLNSSMNVDLGMQYLVLKKISLSTAANVNAVSGWYSQVGIKQTVAGQINERFTFSAYIDIGKNIKVERPMYNNTFRTDFSLHYAFGK